MPPDRVSRRRVLLAVGTGGTLAGCLGIGDGRDPSPGGDAPSGTATPSGHTAAPGDRVLYVSPDGSDDAPGTEARPFGTIRQGLRTARPGDTVYLTPGEYRENLRTVRSGEPGAPITITGPPSAVWRGREPESYVFSIVHSHVHLQGVTINGLLDESRAYETRDAYASTLVGVSPVATHRRDALQPVDYLRDVVVEPSRLGHCSTNMLFVNRLRDASIGGFEVIGPAGMAYHPDVENPIRSHVGEILYIGTGPDDIANDAYPYPWDGLDRTRNVRIHHIDNGAGHHHSELVDIKVGCERITVEYCTDRNAGEQTDGVPAGAISPKSVDCTVRWNDIGECPIAIEFDPYAPGELTDAIEWAEDNDIYGNYLHDYDEAAVAFAETRTGTPSPADQRVFCGNVLDGPDADSYDYATGSCGPAVPDGDGVGHDHRPLP